MNLRQETSKDLHDFAPCNGDINSMLFISRTFDSDLNLVIILVSHKGPLFSPNLSNPLNTSLQPWPFSQPQAVGDSATISATINFIFIFLSSHQFTISFNPLFLQTNLLLNISSISTPSSTKSNQLNLMHSFRLKAFTI